MTRQWAGAPWHRPSCAARIGHCGLAATMGDVARPPAEHPRGWASALFGRLRTTPDGRHDHSGAVLHVRQGKNSVIGP